MTTSHKREQIETFCQRACARTNLLAKLTYRNKAKGNKSMSALVIPPLFIIGCCILAVAIETLNRK